MENIDEMLKMFINKLKENYLINDELMIGCSEEEVKKLEEKFKIKLPKLYRNFLLKMGHLAGGFWKDDYYSYDYLIGDKFDGDSLNDILIAKIIDNYPDKSLPENIFAFWCEPGDLIYCFLVEDNIDNPNYYYSDGGSFPKLAQGTFFDLLMHDADRCDRRWK